MGEARSGGEVVFVATIVLLPIAVGGGMLFFLRARAQQEREMAQRAALEAERAAVAARSGSRQEPLRDRLARQPQESVLTRIGTSDLLWIDQGGDWIHLVRREEAPVLVVFGFGCPAPERAGENLSIDLGDGIRIHLELPGRYEAYLATAEGLVERALEGSLAGLATRLESLESGDGPSVAALYLESTRP